MAMTCAQFEEVVHEIERPGTKGFALRREVLEHAEGCGSCSLLLEKIMSLDFALDTLAVYESDERAPARVELALLAEFRRQRAAEVRPQRNYRLASALAMAAAILLAVVLVAPNWSRRAKKVASNISIATAPQTNAALTGSPAETAPPQESTANEDSGYATNFISLPYADDPRTLDGGTVVRVTLSRAALASFGVPVAELSSTDRIPADIALSEDGVPQAIRLVANADLNQEN